MNHQLQLYLTLIRFDKPIGRVLLAWPAIWGIAHSYHAGASFLPALYYALLLIIAAFLMSGFGCVINDIADREFDRQVERTKMRPLAAGILNLTQALWCAVILALLAGIVFIGLPAIAKAYALAGVTLLFIYPFMKRITHYPQVILGLAFNTGVLVGYACLNGQPTRAIWCLYACGVCWTIAYDTIYAFQDISDDMNVGIKSMAVRFQRCPKVAVGTCYLIGFVFLCLSKSGVRVGGFIYIISAIYTVVTWNPSDSKSCAKHFKLHALTSVFGLF